MESVNSRSGGPRTLLRALGSLWFAALLLILLLVALACATVFESSHGTEQALAVFYKSRWFRLFLVLLGVNILGALTVRFPFKRNQVGFVLTHASILVILLGALVTELWGIDGQAGVGEGQTVGDFSVRRDSLTLANPGSGTRSTVDLAPSVFGGLRTVEEPSIPTLSLDPVRIEVARYLPDSDEREKIVEGGADGRRAIEVSVQAHGGEKNKPVWVFDGQTGTAGSMAVSFRSIADKAELRRLLGETPASQPTARRLVRVQVAGTAFDLPMEDCMERPAAVGTTGYTVRVLRYLPHALVDSDHQLRNASDRPVNPAVEIELVGPEGPQKRFAFARFPDFGSMHGTKGAQEVKVTFVMPTEDVPTAPIEVLAGPDGDLHVRFARDQANVVKKKLEIAVPVETPWSGLTLVVLRRLDRARRESEVVPVEPVRKDREPAVLLRVRTPKHSSDMWVRKYQPRAVSVDGVTYEVTYSDKVAPLGFELTLDRFQLGTYPGTMRPRSYESHVTVVDPATGRKQSHVIGMNHPLSFGGYTLYQSSYRQEKEHNISFLAVAWDPGQPIVFAGYVALMVGMVWVLVQRMREKRIHGSRAVVGNGRAR